MVYEAVLQIASSILNRHNYPNTAIKLQRTSSKMSENDIE